MSNYGRYAYTVKSQICTVRGRWRTDVSDQKKFPGVTVNVKLYQADYVFRLICSDIAKDDYMVKITDAYYDICRESINLLEHVEALETKKCLDTYKEGCFF